MRLFQSVSVIAFRKNYSFVDYHSVPQHRKVLGVTVRLRQSERDDIDGLLSHLELDPRKWESQREFKKQQQQQHSIN